MPGLDTRVSSPIFQVLETTRNEMKKLKILSLILLAYASHMSSAGANEVITWYDVKGLDFLKTNEKKVVKGTNSFSEPAIDLFSYADAQTPEVVNLKLVESNSPNKYGNIGIAFLDNGNKDRTANLYLEGYDLYLTSSGKQTSAINMRGFTSAVRKNMRTLNVVGTDKENIYISGSSYGANLYGNILLNIEAVKNINISYNSADVPSLSGINTHATDRRNPRENPYVTVKINSTDSFNVKGNINHSVSSAGNNLVNISSKIINFDTQVSGQPKYASALLYGTGQINLLASSEVILKGYSANADNGAYKDSYAIRGGATDCNSCGDTKYYYHSDFNINAGEGLINLDTHWGAVYMEAIKDIDEEEQYISPTYHAYTTLSAKNIKIRASGTSNNAATTYSANTTFRAISNYEKADFETQVGAYILLTTRGNDGNQEGNIVIDYVDSLDKEKKQDIFYAYGQTAKIDLDSSYIEINNQYEEGKLGTRADLRNIFFADNASNIALKGKTKIFGNTTARNAATVSLTLEQGSEITGAMFDNSYPYYDSTTETITNFHDNGKVIIKGSQSSVWNVLPYEDSADRGSLFNKDTVRSTVFSIDSDNTTKTNPFIVNLAGPSTAQNSLKSSSAPYQKLNVTNLGENGNGFTQFNLKFDDNKGTSSGQANGHDAVLIHNGQGSHGVYVVYTGDQGSNEAESLRDAWLVQDNSQNASFELTNSGGTVDIGLYKYSLAVEEGHSQIGGNQMANYWYLKRGTSPDKPNPDNPNPDNPVVPPPSDDPLTPGADTLLSFAGSHRYLHWSDLQDLRKRLGEVRYGSQDGAWVRGMLQKDLTDGENGASGLKQNYYGINLGADHLVTKDEKGMVLLGASVNLGRAKQKTRGANNSSGDTDRYGMNGYATWANAEGSYADLVLSADYYRQDINTTANGISQKGKYNTFGLGASIEVGKQFSFESRDLKWGPWYRHTWIEPQLQLSYYWLSGKKYRLSNKGIRVNIKDDDSLIGRAGVVIGTKWNYGDNHYDLNKRYFQAYIKGGVKHDFLGNYKITLNDQIFSKNIGKTTGYYGAGADWQAGSNTRFYLQLEREHGSGYTKEYEVSVGMKYQF